MTQTTQFSTGKASGAQHIKLRFLGMRPRLTISLTASLVWCLLATFTFAADQPLAQFLDDYCIACHNDQEKSGGLVLEEITARPLSERWREMERVVQKLRVGQMPPPGSDRPAADEYAGVIGSLTKDLDAYAKEHIQPAPSPTLRRLTRVEYANAIRDLLDIDIDAEQLLPPDESSAGFDNITVGELSPLLLNRYVSAAQKISRLAIGNISGVSGRTIRIRPDLTQEQRVRGLPLGTRGGAAIDHFFPQSGEYEITVRLARDRNEEIEGLRGEHTLELLLDRALLGEFTVRPPRDKNFSKVDSHLKLRASVKAGPHELGVTFRRRPRLLEEIKRQPYDAHFNMHRHPRLSPAVFQVSVTGPFEPTGPGETPSRKRLLGGSDGNAAETTRAESILRTLMRRAYRRAVTDKDLERPMANFVRRRESEDFDSAIQAAVATVLVSPYFLFRVERPQPGDATARISDFELASRLSFFLWSSIPDDELLSLAEANQLHQADVLRGQVRRMLADPRSESLATNFADQWLQLRNLDSAEPNLRLFPDFDDNLRQSFRRETQLLVLSVLQEDRSVLQLLRSDYTFLNERLARHYEIPHIFGNRFRRVSVTPAQGRGGILRHGSVLTVSSYATRTSPVLRGKWIMENILASPPPPPPENVPALKDNTVNSSLSVRERLAAHRANPACASCHDLIDPIGFALENYDAVGRLRRYHQGKEIDASGVLFDGSRVAGVADLEKALTKDPEVFASAVSEKLLMFALGRKLRDEDASAVRNITRKAKTRDYRLTALIEGVVMSRPFQYGPGAAAHILPLQSEN